MGELVLAAKMCHVPSMTICEDPGPLQGRRDAAITGHRELGRRARALGVQNLVVLDTHSLVNSAYHCNSCERHHGRC